MFWVFNRWQQIELLDEVKSYRIDLDNQLVFHGSYLNGREHGMHSSWYTNGLPREQTNYLDGKKHGVSREWYKNGTLATEATYHHGELCGEYLTWCYTGTLLITKIESPDVI
jgi:antitoxin component YwqK of YwqJK toxin-antitoxin module